MSGALGGGKSSSETRPDTVWGAQSPYLESLYANVLEAGQSPQGQDYAQGFMPGSMQAFNQQAGGGAQRDLTGLQGMAAGGGQDFAGQQNQALGGAIDAGLGQISRNFQQNIMPGINTGAAQAGTSGGSRQGIAQGLAAGEANRQSSDFVNQMQSENFNQMMNRNIAQQQAGQQAQLGAYSQLGQFDQMQNQAQQGAMGLAPQLSNLGFGAQYGNLQNQAELFGRPTVLGGGGGSSSWNMSTSGGLW